MNESTLLYRQVHPDLISPYGEPGNEIFLPQQNIFNPSERDEGLLSVYNGEKYSALTSWKHYTKTLKSCGVIAVTAGECAEENLPAKENNYPFDGHTNINFNDFQKGDRKAKAKKLRIKAISRGWQHKADARLT